ncbi:MAG: polysaccharide deacetylase family protein [Planctomycetes bacterium]|nr:polysaccharide deacetylase family protein [Planctomycetota bacterium]
MCYHRILPAQFKARYFVPDLVVTPEAFRHHCRILKQCFDTRPLGEALDILQNGNRNSRPLAAITFDDGYQDNFRFAVPILNEVDLRATFFVISNLIGTSKRPWYDELAHLVSESESFAMALNWLNRNHFTSNSSHQLDAQGIVALAKKLGTDNRRELIEQLSEGRSEAVRTDDCIVTSQQMHAMQSAGHEIGSHSSTHEILTQLDDASLAHEVAGSRRQIEELLGRSIRLFCYPNGDTDDRVVEAVRSAGYTHAVTTESGANLVSQDRFRLRRSFIHEDRLSGLNGKPSDSLLRMEVLGLTDRIFRRRQRMAPA